MLHYLHLIPGLLALFHLIQRLLISRLFFLSRQVQSLLFPGDGLILFTHLIKDIGIGVVEAFGISKINGKFALTVSIDLLIKQSPKTKKYEEYQ